jgi:hypothetical protein
VECLEGRALLSFYTGPSANRPVHSSAGAFFVQVNGPGVVNVHPAGKGAINLIAYGTTPATTLTITQVRPRWHFPNQLLPINALIVRSGQLGGLDAPSAELTGQMSPLIGSVSSLDLGAIGPAARVDINGDLGALNVSSVDLGPTGHVEIAGDLGSSASSTSSSGLSTLGAMMVGSMNLDRGRFLVGRDALAPITIQRDLTITQDGSLSIGRDLAGSLTVGGSLILANGGQIVVGRNLDNLAVNGNLRVSPGGSGIAVGGALNGLTVNGYFQGQGGTAAPSAIDLGVGLNLSGLTILGGLSGQGGLINANIRAGGSVSQVDIVYGTVNSTIRPYTSTAM